MFGALKNMFGGGSEAVAEALNNGAAIIDVRIVTLDCPSYNTRDPLKVIAETERLKEKKYSDICASHRKSYHPFVMSANGLIGPSADKLLQRLGRLLSEQIQRPYSVVMNDLRSRLSIACAKTVHAMLRTTRRRPFLTNPLHNSGPHDTDPPPEFLLVHG